MLSRMQSLYWLFGLVLVVSMTSARRSRIELPSSKLAADTDPITDSPQNDNKNPLALGLEQLPAESDIKNDDDAEIPPPPPSLPQFLSPASLSSSSSSEVFNSKEAIDTPSSGESSAQSTSNTSGQVEDECDSDMIGFEIVTG